MENQRIKEIKHNEYSARINLSRGANCISLRHSAYKAEILREPDYSKELDNPYLYGMPILFPVNRISGGRFEFEGRVYSFPINEPKINSHVHGMLHEMDFCIKEIWDNSVTCVYEATKEKPYLAFPHAFEIVIKYDLCDEGLVQTNEIVNHSDENMPVFIGFHTTFNSLFTEKSKPDNMCVSVDITEEFERNMQNYLPTGKKPEFDSVSEKLSKGLFNPFEQAISRHYRAGGNKMVIYDKENDLSIVYENDEKLGFRLIYNGNADEYICLEPQNCLANCQNSPFDRKEAGFDFIKPNRTKTYYSKIYITEGDKR